MLKWCIIATLSSVNTSYRNLFWRPRIQVYRFYTRYMYAQIAMNCCTANTEKDPKIPWCPCWTYNNIISTHKQIEMQLIMSGSCPQDLNSITILFITVTYHCYCNHFKHRREKWLPIALLLSYLLTGAIQMPPGATALPLTYKYPGAFSEYFVVFLSVILWNYIASIFALHLHLVLPCQ